MKRRFSEEQMIGILKQQEGGLTVAQTCRQHNISEVGALWAHSIRGKASSEG